MNSRYYDADLKRFTSIDPWSGNLSEPQTLNKYSYVKNNPIKYNDPSGEIPVLAIPLAIGAVKAVGYGLTAWGAYDIAKSGVDAYNTGGVAAGVTTVGTALAVEATIGKATKIAAGAKAVLPKLTEFAEKRIGIRQGAELLGNGLNHPGHTASKWNHVPGSTLDQKIDNIENAMLNPDFNISIPGIKDVYYKQSDNMLIYRNHNDLDKGGTVINISDAKKAVNKMSNEIKRLQNSKK